MNEDAREDCIKGMSQIKVKLSKFHQILEHIDDQNRTYANQTAEARKVVFDKNNQIGRYVNQVKELEKQIEQLKFDNENLTDELDNAREINEIQQQQIIDLQDKSKSFEASRKTEEGSKKTDFYNKFEASRDKMHHHQYRTNKEQIMIQENKPNVQEQKSQFGFGMISSVFSTITNVINQQDDDDDYDNNDNEYKESDSPKLENEKFNPNKTQKLSKIQEDESDEGINFPTVQNPTQKDTTNVFEIDNNVDLNAKWGNSSDEIDIDIDDDVELDEIDKQKESPKNAVVWKSPDEQANADPFSDNIFLDFEDNSTPSPKNIQKPSINQMLAMDFSLSKSKKKYDVK